MASSKRAQLRQCHGVGLRVLERRLDASCLVGEEQRSFAVPQLVHRRCGEQARRQIEQAGVVWMMPQRPVGSPEGHLIVATQNA